MGFNSLLLFGKKNKYDYSNKKNNFFVRLDLFGTIYLPSLFYQNEQKSIYGSVLTLFLFLIIFIKITLIIYRLIIKDHYSLKINTFNDQEIPIKLNNFSIAICSDNNFSIQDNIKYNSFSLSNNSKNIYSDPKLIKHENFNECINYDLNNTNLEDSDDPRKIVFASTFFEIINNNTNSFFDIKILLPFIYPSITNYYNPLKKRVKILYINESSTRSKTINIYLSKLQIIYKNNFIFDFKNESEDYVIIEKTEISDNEEFLDSIGNNYIHIYYSGWRTQYIFKGYDLDSDISSFGGFINFYFFIFNLIGRITNSFLMYNTIKSNLSKRRSRTLTFKRNLTSTALNQKNCVLNLSAFNRPSEEKFVKNKNNFFMKKNTIFEPKNRNNFSTTNNNLLNEQENSFIFFEKDKEQEDFEIYQFQRIIDYGYIYQILKDFILIQILSLNSEKAKIFFEKRKKCINVMKLEKEMLNCLYSNNLNFFDKLQNKIDLINKNIFIYNKNDNANKKEVSFAENNKK